MDDLSNNNPTSSDTANRDEPPSTSATRPSTLNILFGNGSKDSSIHSFPTSLEELQPLFKNEIEKLIQQFKASPQTPGSFLNPKNVTEEQEIFVNAFSKKLEELQESNNRATIAATQDNCSNVFNVGLSGVAAQKIPDFAEMCRQAVQQSQGLVNPSILLYSPISINSNASAIAQLSQQLIGLDSQKSAGANTCLSGQTSLAVPLSTPSKDTTTIQLANGLKFEIKANSVSQASVLKMLGLSNPQEVCQSNQSSQIDPSSWSVHTQNISSTEGVNSQSPHADSINGPSSTTNSFDLLQRPASSGSTGSSASRPNSRGPLNNRIDICLDPTEQYRMRLERKRARNRDAARKCRERKIRLIKSLEKDVFYLTEENKSLRYRISRSKTEVERLKNFVVAHIENKCPVLNA